MSRMGKEGNGSTGMDLIGMEWWESKGSSAKHANGAASNRE